MSQEGFNLTQSSGGVGWVCDIATTSVFLAALTLAQKPWSIQLYHLQPNLLIVKLIPFIQQEEVVEQRVRVCCCFCCLLSSASAPSPKSRPPLSEPIRDTYTANITENLKLLMKSMDAIITLEEKEDAKLRILKQDATETKINQDELVISNIRGNVLKFEGKMRCLIKKMDLEIKKLRNKKADHYIRQKIHQGKAAKKQQEYVSRVERRKAVDKLLQEQAQARTAARFTAVPIDDSMPELEAQFAAMGE